MILYLDTETTALYPGQICQLSYVMQTESAAYAKNFFYTVGYMDKGAQAVHGFSAEKLYALSNGRVFADSAEEVSRDFAGANLLVAHNISFDLTFLRKEFECAREPFGYKETFCTMKKFTPYCALRRGAGRSYKYPRLGELCARLNISPSEIACAAQSLFGENASEHDARFDSAAVFLAFNAALALPDFIDYKGFLQ